MCHFTGWTFQVQPHEDGIESPAASAGDEQRDELLPSWHSLRMHAGNQSGILKNEKEFIFNRFSAILKGIRSGVADVAMFDAGDVYSAGLNVELIPILSEVYNFRCTSKVPLKSYRLSRRKSGTTTSIWDRNFCAPVSWWTAAQVASPCGRPSPHWSFLACYWRSSDCK